MLPVMSFLHYLYMIPLRFVYLVWWFPHAVMMGFDSGHGIYDRTADVSN